jgi:hypothetical protein
MALLRRLRFEPSRGSMSVFRRSTTEPLHPAFFIFLFRSHVSGQKKRALRDDAFSLKAQ